MVKQIHSETCHWTFKPHTVKFTFCKYLTGSKNGKAYHSCDSFTQLNQLTIENLKTIQIWEACDYSQKLNWNRLQHHFPAPGASAHVIPPNPANKEEKGVGPCQQVVLSTCLHLGEIRKRSSRARGATPGTEYSKRWWGRKGQCITEGDFQFFSSDATKYYSQSEFYLYADTHIYKHNADQTSVCTLSLQGETKTFRKVVGTSAFFFCFEVTATELSN